MVHKFVFATLAFLVSSQIFASDILHAMRTDALHSLRFAEGLSYSISDTGPNYSANSDAHICYKAGVVESSLANMFKNYRRNASAIDQELGFSLGNYIEAVAATGLSGLSSRSFFFCTHTALEDSDELKGKREDLRSRASRLEDALKRLVEAI